MLGGDSSLYDTIDFNGKTYTEMFKSALDKINIKVIDDDIIGSQFDTDFMDAVSAVKCTKNLDGTVESVVEPGFVDSVSKKTYVHAKVVVRKYI